jgi:CheY-specific phosphatase CheX
MSQLQLPLIDALDKLLESSIKHALLDIPIDDHWHTQDVSNFKDIDTERAVILTVANHHFKLLVTIDFTANECKYFVKNHLFSAKEVFDDNVFNDYILEMGNSICGVLKRELGKSIPALGMSTPNFLSRESIDYIAGFGPEKHICKQITYNEQLAFFVNCYLITNSKSDFSVNIVEDDVDAGELELF